MRSGDDPMDRCPREDDGTHMTVLHDRYVTRARMTGPARDGGRRFSKRSSASPPPMDGGLTKVEQLRERIALGTLLAQCVDASRPSFDARRHSVHLHPIDPGLAVFAASPVQLALCLVLGVLTGVAAGIRPARRAARLNPLTAIAAT